MFFIPFSSLSGFHLFLSKAIGTKSLYPKIKNKKHKIKQQQQKKH